MKICRPLVLILALVSAAAVGQEGADARVSRLDPDRPTVLITGSNRGIGLGFATAYAANGWNVIATARNPDGAAELQDLVDEYDAVVIEELDVTDSEELSRLSDAYASTPIDVLINNAAFHGGEPEDNWIGTYNYDTFETYMRVNVFGPLAVSEAFYNAVAQSDQKKIVTITTSGASLATQAANQRTARIGAFQIISKAAVNMAMLAFRSQARADDIIVALVSPGVVATDGAAAMFRIMQAASLQQPPSDASQSAGQAPPQVLSVEDSVQGMMQVIADLDNTYDGSHLDYKGDIVPW